MNGKGFGFPGEEGRTQRSAVPVSVPRAYRIERPSRDQLMGSSAGLSASSTSSLPPPLDAFWNISVPPRRVELNTRRLPSGDQIGDESGASANVERVLSPRARSNNHRSFAFAV